MIEDSSILFSPDHFDYGWVLTSVEFGLDFRIRFRRGVGDQIEYNVVTDIHNGYRRCTASCILNAEKLYRAEAGFGM